MAVRKVFSPLTMRTVVRSKRREMIANWRVGRMIMTAMLEHFARVAGLVKMDILATICIILCCLE